MEGLIVSADSPFLYRLYQEQVALEVVPVVTRTNVMWTLASSAAHSRMDFAQSTFTLEVNQTPVLVFQAKWAAEAEDIGFGWAQDHLQQLSTKGSYGTNLPPIIKVRIARHDEKAAYEIQSNNSDLYAGVKIVYLIDLNSLS